MTKQKTLYEERMKFYDDLVKKYPNFKWGLLYNHIFEQDKQALKQAQEKLDTYFFQKCDKLIIKGILEEVFGKELIE